MSLFLFGNSCYKRKESFKMFFPQILEVYRILLVKTTLESIIFYYTFSVINTMFVPCTALLYDSTAATRTLKLSTTLLSISCGICLISFLILETSGITSHGTDSFRVKPITLVILFPRSQPDYFLRGYLKDSVCENNPQTREGIIRKEIRRIPQEMLNRVVDNFNVRVADVLSYSSAMHGTNTVLNTEKV